MLTSLNRILERVMPIITPLSVILGIAFSGSLHPFAGLAPWIFALMTFSGSLNSNFRDLKKVLYAPFPMVAVFLILHLFMPIISWGLGNLFFHGDSYTITGFVLASVIPAGITSFIWISMYGGNIALALAFILLDSLLSPFVVPLSLSLFVGTKVHMDVFGIMNGLFWMIGLPSLIGMLLNQWTKGNIKKSWGPTLSPVSKICVAIVVMLNSSVVAPFFTAINEKLLSIGALLLFLSFLGYVLAIAVGKMLKWENDIVVSMTFNSGMRNINAGTVLAVSYFPPAVAIPVVLAMIYNQTLASFFGFLLKQIHIVEDNPESSTRSSAA
jgi:bile acid:Na+ symporter, BASS family